MLYIDGVPVARSEGRYLAYDWDTTAAGAGEHLLSLGAPCPQPDHASCHRVQVMGAGPGP